MIYKIGEDADKYETPSTFIKVDTGIVGGNNYAKKEFDSLFWNRYKTISELSSYSVEESFISRKIVTFKGSYIVGGTAEKRDLTLSADILFDYVNKSLVIKLEDIIIIDGGFGIDLTISTSELEKYILDMVIPQDKDDTTTNPITISIEDSASVATSADMVGLGVSTDDGSLILKWKYLGAIESSYTIKPLIDLRIS
jgi:hypothetical protein